MLKVTTSDGSNLLILPNAVYSRYSKVKKNIRCYTNLRKLKQTLLNNANVVNNKDDGN